MVLYDFFAAFSRDLVAHVDLEILDTFQRFVTTDAYLSLFVWTSITCASTNHLLTKLSTQKGTALGSFLFLFTMISVLAGLFIYPPLVYPFPGSTLFAVLTGQPIPWLKNDQIPHALVAMCATFFDLL